MHLTSIDMSNFRVFRQVHLELSETVSGIVGPNGAGKSSIVEAVAWVLYGNSVARSSKDEIKSTFAGPGDSCEVALSFVLRDHEYRVVRRLVGKTERPEVMLYRSGTPESAGSTDTNRLIAELLGLDWRGFLTSFLARQQELNALAELAPAQRREHLAGMLGIQLLDRAIQKTKEDSRLLGIQIDLLEHDSRRAGELRAELEHLREHVELVRADAGRATDLLAESRQRFGAAELTYREHQYAQSSCSELTGRMDGFRLTREHLGNQLAGLQNSLADLLSAVGELASLEDRLVLFDTLKLELAELQGAKVRTGQRIDVQKQLESAVRETADLETRFQALDVEQDSIGRELAILPPDLEQQHREAVAGLERAREEWSHARSRVEMCRQGVSKLEEQIRSVAEIGPETVCDRCGRPYGDDLPAIRQHLTEDLTVGRSELAREERALTDRRTEGEDLKGRVAELEIKVQRRRELSVQADMLSKQVEQLTGLRRSAAARLEALNVQLANLGEVCFDPARLAALGAEVAELEQTHRRALELRGRVAALDQTRTRLDQVQRELEDCDRHIEKLEKDIAALNFDPERFAALAAEFATRQRDVEENQQAVTRLTRELELGEQEQRLKGQELSRLEEAARLLEQQRTARFYTEKLSGLFTDFRKHTISRIRPRLADLASELMSQMSGGRYSLVELDPDYNIQVMDYGSYFGVERFSGGEKDLASLCLRLAISLALTESAGLDRSFVILDEVFGSQDSNRRETILQALTSLKSRFSQMLLITHLEEFRHKVETLIEVRPTGSGWSEVIVDGQTA